MYHLPFGKLFVERRPSGAPRLLHRDPRSRGNQTLDQTGSRKGSCWRLGRAGVARGGIVRLSECQVRIRVLVVRSGTHPVYSSKLGMGPRGARSHKDRWALHMEQMWIGDLIRHWKDDEVGRIARGSCGTRASRTSVPSGAASVAEIKADTFGNAYRGSSLETVMDSIAEQRQVFKGADHAFMWKPKLRMPDIYENRLNQIAFGNFLDTCICCDAEEQVIEAIQSSTGRPSKVSVPQRQICSTFCILRSHRRSTPPSCADTTPSRVLTGATVKLGRWDQYLAMRRGILALNLHYRSLLSDDLGAVTAFLFDVGAGRYPLPEREKEDGSSNAGSPTSIRSVPNPQRRPRRRWQPARRIIRIQRFKGGFGTWVSPSAFKSGSPRTMERAPTKTADWRTVVSKGCPQPWRTPAQPTRSVSSTCCGSNKEERWLSHSKWST